MIFLQNARTNLLRFFVQILDVQKVSETNLQYNFQNSGEGGGQPNLESLKKIIANFIRIRP